MKKYYIIADMKREPTNEEKKVIPTSGQIYLGKIKTIVEAETWEEAYTIGKKIITGSLRKGIKAINWTWNEVAWVEKNGDKEIYDKYPTATRIAYHRIQKGLTQQQLANTAGVNIRLIQKVENGEAQTGNLTARNLLAIANALNVEPKELI